MKIINSIINLISGRNQLSIADVPEGICPNCWGRNEYGGAFYEAIKNEGIDMNELKSRVGWIQNYVDTHLNEIILKDIGDEKVCAKCKVGYRKVS